MYLEEERSMYPSTAAAEAGLRYEFTIGINVEESRGHRNTINPGHPESHARIEAIVRRMEEEGIMESVQIVRKFLPIDESDLHAIHSKEHVEGVFSTASKTQEENNEWASGMDSVFVTPLSLAAARSAVACCKQLAEWIVAGKIPSALALVRPPGHHADPETGCGFCLFNNAAAAVDAARVEGARRILVVDLDVHHGQGTQRVFKEDDDVLYFSIHRHEYGRFWPNLEESGSMEIGEGRGRGYTVNVPLQETGCGDADYLFILHALLMPLAREWRPELVVVSAGFDSLAGDPLGGMELSPAGYSHLIAQMRTLAEGRMLVVLEGGYNHAMVAEGAMECARVMRGERPGRMERGGGVKESVRESVLNTIAALMPYWKCLRQYDSQEFRKSYPSPSAFRFEPPERDIPTADIDQERLRKPKRKERVHRRYRTVVVHAGKAHEEHEHREGNSYEKADRIRVCLDRLSSLSIPVEEVEGEEERVMEWIESVHQREYVERLRRTEGMSDAELEQLSSEWGDSFVTRGTWRAAVAGVAAVIRAVDAVFSPTSTLTSAFALVRPPGHHAHRSHPSGFCFLNNAAIAAKYLLSLFPSSGRVLIVDWDVHLGDGTIDCLSSLPSSSCLYLSLHRSEQGTFFPVCRREETVDGRGERREGIDHEENKDGHVLVPFSGAPMGDAAYLAAIDRIILPVAYSYRPDAIVVSAGFDCLKDDPLGGYAVSPSTLSALMGQLQAVAPVVAQLEGGYNVDALSAGVEAVVRTMNGERAGRGERGGRICLEAMHSLRVAAGRCGKAFDLVLEQW